MSISISPRDNSYSITTYTYYYFISLYWYYYHFILHLHESCCIGDKLVSDNTKPNQVLNSIDHFLKKYPGIDRFSEIVFLDLNTK